MIWFVSMAAALAQQEACYEDYTHEAWEAHLNGVDEALHNVDIEGARDLLRKSHKLTLCLVEPARPSYVARLARQLAMTFFFEQDEDAIRRWVFASNTADPELSWPRDIDASHPLRAQVAMQEPPEVTGPEGGLVVPTKGAFLANGRPLLEPRAAVEIPLFVQVMDKKGVIVHQYWQDGSAFPEDIIDPDGGPLKTPKWYAPEPESARTKMRDPLFGELDSGPEGVEEPAVAKVDEEPVRAEPDPVDAPPPIEAVAEADPSENTESDPVADASPSPAVASVSIPSTVGLSSYVDPFEEARLRAIARETVVRDESDRTITTEVITLVEDHGPGGPVLQEDFSAWLAYRPQYSPNQIDPALGPRGYLKTWKNLEPPDGRAPVTWVGFEVARLYCDDWGGGFATTEAGAVAADFREWRIDGEGNPVIVSAKETATEQIDPDTVAADLGFRCSR